MAKAWVALRYRYSLRHFLRWTVCPSICQVPSRRIFFWGGDIRILVWINQWSKAIIKYSVTCIYLLDYKHTLIKGKTKFHVLFNLNHVLKGLSKYTASFEVTEFLHECYTISNKGKTDHWWKMQVTFMSNKLEKTCRLSLTC